MKATITPVRVLIITILVTATAVAQQSSSSSHTVSFGVHRYTQNVSVVLSMASNMTAVEPGVAFTQVKSLNNQVRKISVGIGSLSINYTAQQSPAQQPIAYSSRNSQSILEQPSDVQRFSFSPDPEPSKTGPIVITVTE